MGPGLCPPSSHCRGTVESLHPRCANNLKAASTRRQRAAAAGRAHFKGRTAQTETRSTAVLMPNFRDAPRRPLQHIGPCPDLLVSAIRARARRRPSFRPNRHSANPQCPVYPCRPSQLGAHACLSRLVAAHGPGLDQSTIRRGTSYIRPIPSPPREGPSQNSRKQSPRAASAADSQPLPRRRLYAATASIIPPPTPLSSGRTDERCRARVLLGGSGTDGGVGEGAIVLVAIARPRRTRKPSLHRGLRPLRRRGKRVWYRKTGVFRLRSCRSWPSPLALTTSNAVLAVTEDKIGADLRRSASESEEDAAKLPAAVLNKSEGSRTEVGGAKQDWLLYGGDGLTLVSVILLPYTCFSRSPTFLPTLISCGATVPTVL
uniref:Uncharacterized protein n=1 Tax=Mycena chlorophos TaxID=658473 RepID=A0ABQ0M1S7_MYCCL|nr:predicted protein [Mycena chlorophos]